MGKQRKKFLRERTVTIILTTLTIPFGTFVGYEFGAGNTNIALIALGIQTALVFAQSTMWWFTIEKMRD